VFTPRPRERYPMRFDIAYPGSLSRWKTLLRLPLVIPALLFGWAVSYLINAAFPIGWLTVFVRRKYPAWLFVGLSGALAWTARYNAYGLLLTDRYPSFGGENSTVLLEYDEPPDGHLSRFRVFFWKLALLIPHFVLLTLLWVAVAVTTIFAWFAILITGRYPRGLFSFATGFLRWGYRVAGYFASFNDRFPPFSLSSEAGPGSTAAAWVCGVVGALVFGFFGLVIGIVVAEAGAHDDVTVSYAALTANNPTPARYTLTENHTIRYVVQLGAAVDSNDAFARAAGAGDGVRAVSFDLAMTNRRDLSDTVHRADITLRYADPSGDTHWVEPATTMVNGAPAPGEVPFSTRATAVRVVFLIPTGARPDMLEIVPPWRSESSTGRTLRFVFQ
jgi:hypothetical protein